MPNALLEKCVELLRREDVRAEIKRAIAPLVGVALDELHPYIQICLLLVLVSFLLQAATFILIFRNRKSTAQTFS
tara:strand:+ start:541 stop:765 length:225 start_codon:yes stop_codon:yes gene_type:complete